MQATNTVEQAGIEWDIREGLDWTPYAAEYCADGDGMVRVSQRLRGCFKGFLVFDQMQYMGKHDTLEAALDHAATILKNDYSEIHDAVCFI